MNILITTSTFGKFDRRPLELLEQAGFSYSLNPYGRKLTKEEFLNLIGDSVGVIAGIETLDGDVLEKLPNVKVISRCGVGLDSVDIETAKKLSIIVKNAPHSVTIAVSELTVGVILDLLRKVSRMNQKLKSGIWKKEMGNLLCGKKIGIIGFGRIGQKVAELILPFGVQVSYYDTQKINDQTLAQPKDFESLLSWSDIITLHLSVSKQAKPIIGPKEIRLIKKGSWLVNMARGGLVNEKALYDALVDGHLAGAALDVFSDEPYSGPLRTLEQVVLTPHIGSYALEARVAMEIETVENLISALKTFSEQER